MKLRRKFKVETILFIVLTIFLIGGGFSAIKACDVCGSFESGLEDEKEFEIGVNLNEGEGDNNYLKNRSCGVFMPIFSVPNSQGIGTFGEEAYKFVDFLASTGQTFWQILPLGITDDVNSPYQSCSTFAGNLNYIDLPLLEKEGLLTAKDYCEIDWGDGDRVNFKKVNENKNRVLHIAYKNWIENSNCARREIEKFLMENYWAKDFACFMVLAEKEGSKGWRKWRREFRDRKKSAMKEFENANKEEINFWIFTQIVFFKQWFSLKEYANSKGIKIIGDLPFYVSMGSADVWANKNQFWIDNRKNNYKILKIAGVPADIISSSGQSWGNPLYRWNEMKKDGYKWWISRINFHKKMYDVLRLDHFQAFEKAFFYEPDSNSGEEKVSNNQLTNPNMYNWDGGPGEELFKCLAKNNISWNNLLVEDLGTNTGDVGKAVEKLRDNFKFPGVKVLTYAFNGDVNENPHMPDNFQGKDWVVYTSTHDTNTVEGWYNETLNRPYVLNNFTRRVEKALSTNECSNLDLKLEDYASWKLIKLAMNSKANVVIVPIEDYLSLGEHSRINIPGIADSRNWSWRLDRNFLEGASRYLTGGRVDGKIAGIVEGMKFVAKKTFRSLNV